MSRRANVACVSTASRCLFPQSRSFATPPSASSPGTPIEVTYFNDFLCSEVDYCLLLLEEAHRKHGLALNLPHQKNPPTDPWVIRLPEAMVNRMKEHPPPYEPRYGPPPEGLDAPSKEDGMIAAPNEAPTDSTDAEESSGVLPSDKEVDQLLRKVWDVVGCATVKGFRAAAAAVYGLTKEIKTSASLRPKPQQPQSVAVTSVGPRRSVKEMVSEWANPFESLGDDIVGEASASTASEAPESGDRLFSCHMCAKTFRLMSALGSHYEQRHGIPIPADRVRAFNSLYAGRSDSKRGAPPPIVLPGFLEHGAGLPRVKVLTKIDTTSNIVLVGRIEKVEAGRVRGQPVTQILLCVEEDPQPTLLGPEDDPTDTPAAHSIVQYITVRCFDGASGCSALCVGMEVIVHGTLRLQQMIEQTTKKAVSHPIVQVVSPFGEIHPL